MKTKKAGSSAAEFKTAASRRAEQLRTRCNSLSDSERRELMDEGMRLFYPETGNGGQAASPAG